MLSLPAFLVALAAATPGTAAAAALPAPDAPIPRTSPALAERLTDTTLRLRAAIGVWRAEGDPGRGAPPRDVTLLALHHQRIYRVLVRDRSLGRRVLARLPRAVLGEARDTIAARRALAAIPKGAGRTPRVRTTRAEPADVLRAAYDRAQRRFGVDAEMLAAVNLVESAFGRVRSASSAGARGPMQFLPATWEQYGMGGDIEDTGDAILGAANYLRASGAPRDERRALFAYNRSTSYVSAILRFARRMQADPRTFYTYYAWQVYARTPGGVRRLTGPGR